MLTFPPQIKCSYCPQLFSVSLKTVPNRAKVSLSEADTDTEHSACSYLHYQTLFKPVITSIILESDVQYMSADVAAIFLLTTFSQDGLLKRVLSLQTLQETSH